MGERGLDPVLPLGVRLVGWCVVLVDFSTGFLLGSLTLFVALAVLFLGTCLADTFLLPFLGAMVDSTLLSSWNKKVFRYAPRQPASLLSRHPPTALKELCVCSIRLQRSIFIPLITAALYAERKRSYVAQGLFNINTFKYYR